MQLLHAVLQDSGALVAEREDRGEAHSCSQRKPTAATVTHRFVCVLQGALIDLLEDICNILPPSYHSQCQALVGKIGKTVLDAILSYATPKAICSLLHMCKGEEASPFGQWMNKCSVKLPV